MRGEIDVYPNKIFGSLSITNSQTSLIHLKNFLRLFSLETMGASNENFEAQDAIFCQYCGTVYQTEE